MWQKYNGNAGINLIRGDFCSVMSLKVISSAKNRVLFSFYLLRVRVCVCVRRVRIVLEERSFRLIQLFFFLLFLLLRRSWHSWELSQNSTNFAFYIIIHFISQIKGDGRRVFWDGFWFRFAQSDVELFISTFPCFQCKQAIFVSPSIPFRIEKSFAQILTWQPFFIVYKVSWRKFFSFFFIIQYTLKRIALDTFSTIKWWTIWIILSIWGEPSTTLNLMRCILVLLERKQRPFFLDFQVKFEWVPQQYNNNTTYNEM